MFCCEGCSKSVGLHVKQMKVVIKKRYKEYPRRQKANIGFKYRGNAKVKSKSKSDRIDDPGGRGWETVSELKMCPSCAKKAEGK